MSEHKAQKTITDKQAKLIAEEMDSMMTGGFPKLQELLHLDVSNPIMEAFQSQDSLTFNVAVERDGIRNEYIFGDESKRTIADIEKTYSKDMSEFSVNVACAFFLLKATQREALQAHLFLATIDTLETQFKLHPDMCITFQSNKQHKLHPWTERTITLDANDIALAKLVATACLARFEKTERALATRSKTKRANRPVTAKFSRKTLRIKKS